MLFLIVIKLIITLSASAYNIYIALKIHSKLKDKLLAPSTPTITQLINLEFTLSLNILHLETLNNFFKTCHFIHTELATVYKIQVTSIKHVYLMLASLISLFLFVLGYDFYTTYMGNHMRHYESFLVEIFNTFSMHILDYVKILIIKVIEKYLHAINSALIQSQTEKHFDVSAFQKLHLAATDLVQFINILFGWNIFLESLNGLVFFVRVVNGVINNRIPRKEYFNCVIWTFYIAVSTYN